MVPQLGCVLLFRHFNALGIEISDVYTHFFLNCLKSGWRFLVCLAPLLYSRYIMSSAPDMDAIEPCRRDTKEF